MPVARKSQATRTVLLPVEVRQVRLGLVLPEEALLLTLQRMRLVPAEGPVIMDQRGPGSLRRALLNSLVLMAGWAMMEQLAG